MEHPSCCFLNKLTVRSKCLVLLGILLFGYAIVRQTDWHVALPSIFFHPQAVSTNSPSSQGISCLDGNWAMPTRAHSARITDFGAIGDGVTLNTQAFERAMTDLRKFSERGGAQLNVPAGKWLTGCFNLTSHLTLYLERGALILASQDPLDWPLIEALPSYGHGRERPGRRHSSLIHGENLADVVITGENGTIDGQGSIWWEMWWNRSLEHTRGHLVEFINSKDLIISNVVLQNSPFWTLHPVYCNHVIIKNLTILAPANAPNTDGIDPDSSSNVCIEDCYISNGDDLIAIKSGWDEYGINVAHPSSNITIRRVTGSTPTCSGLAFGSEISGGITNVTVRDMYVFNASAGIRLKTAPGRGGYITNITISGMILRDVKRAIEFSGDAGEHPDESYNRSAFSVVKGIVMDGIVGDKIQLPGRFVSVPEAPFLDVCLFNISLNLVSEKHRSWTCSSVHGSSFSVSPMLCPELQNSSSNTHNDSCRIAN